jgi:hypothetical protein
MKRTIFLIFLVILLLTVCGCGDVKDNDVTPSDTTAAITTEAPATDTTKTEETTAPPETETPIIWASEPDSSMSEGIFLDELGQKYTKTRIKIKFHTFLC